MIDLAHRDDVAILTMAHGKANLFDLEFCAALTKAFEGCAQSSSKAVVVTAQGPIFSGGVDLRRLVEGGSPYVDRFLPAMSDTFEAIFAFSKPLVAAVTGHAIAGGCILACAADRRVMARGPGKIGIPELLVGVPFPIVPLEIMRHTVAPPRLATLVNGGETFTADAAVDWGLVDAAVDPDRLLEDAIAAAAAMARLTPAAFAYTKSLLRAPALGRIRDGKATDPAVHRAWAAPETLDAVRRYVERTLKRP